MTRKSKYNITFGMPEKDARQYVENILQAKREREAAERKPIEWRSVWPPRA